MELSLAARQGGEANPLDTSGLPSAVTELGAQTGG
jgi:hypothetical protein